MLRFALLIALLLTASTAQAQSGALHRPSDPRLVVAPTMMPAARPTVLADGSRWKAGAVTGGILGGIVGFTLGYGMDNIINEGRMSAGENSVGWAALGAAGGALLGAGIGSLIRR